MQTDDLVLMEEMVQPMILEDNTDEEMPLNDHDHDNDIDLDADMGEGEARKKRSKASNDVATHSRLLDSHIKIALSLYKVQQNIYLLDFQRIEVRQLISYTSSHISFLITLNREMLSVS